MLRKSVTMKKPERCSSRQIKQYDSTLFYSNSLFCYVITEKVNSTEVCLKSNHTNSVPFRKDFGQNTWVSTVFFTAHKVSVFHPPVIVSICVQ